MSDPEWGEPRTRTVTWYDPVAAAARGARMSGREHIQAIADGVLPPPPFGSLLGFRITEVGAGEVEFRVVPGDWVYNTIGAVHGGMVATLLDSVCGCAVATLLDAGVGYTSIEIKVSFVRAIREDTGEIVARGRVVKPGRRVMFAEGDVRDRAGALLATATSSLLVMPTGG